MAKFVIAGSANCPYYARAELLADNLQTNLPDFRIHKIVKHPDDWEIWLSETCKKNGWSHTHSPLIWRELIDRGGKGVLIGGSNEFQEYAIGYYGITSDMLSSDMTTVGSENMETHVLVTEEEEYKQSLSKPLHMCITNASSVTAYHMLHEIASGEVLGEDTELSLHLLVDEEEYDVAQGVKLEAIDMACPLLREICVATNPMEAINRASLIVILDDLSQKETESWEEWIKRCAAHYMNYGSIINKWASSDCRIVVAGNGAVNLGAYMIKQEAKHIPRQNIVVPSRLLENRAKSSVARRINVNSSGVIDIIVWGNNGGTTHLDVSRGRVHGCEGAIWGPPFYSRPVEDMVHDNKWLQTEYRELLKSHKDMVEGSLQHSAASSEAHSIVATISDWWNGSKEGQIFSMGVVSEGWYQVPEGLFFSFPVRFQKGSWRLVQDLNVTDELREELSKIVDELEREIEVIFPSPNKVKKVADSQEDATAENKGEKVFGQPDRDGTADTKNSPLTPDGDNNEATRNVTLSRIIEESETDTREGTTVTETDKEG